MPGRLALLDESQYLGCGGPWVRLTLGMFEFGDLGFRDSLSDGSYLGVSCLSLRRSQTAGQLKIRCSVQFLGATRLKLDLMPGQGLVDTALLGRAV